MPYLDPQLYIVQDVMTFCTQSSDGSEVVVLAPCGTIGKRWPLKITHDAKTWEFVTNEIMSADERTEYGGKARYKVCDTSRREG